MKSIKFSDDYEKLPRDWVGSSATLFSVSRVDLDVWKRRHPKFFNYDTKFRGKLGNYQLNFKDALLLVFVPLGFGAAPFTTIRRFTPEKFEFYRGSVGEEFMLQKTE